MDPKNNIKSSPEENNLRNRIKDILERTQGLPQKTKKVILVLIVLIVGLILGFIWLQQTKKRLADFKKEGLMGEYNISSLKEEIEGELQGAFSSEIGVNTERLKRLKKLMEENPEQAKKLLEEIKQNPEKAEQLISEFEKKNNSSVPEEKLEE